MDCSVWKKYERKKLVFLLHIEKDKPLTWSYPRSSSPKSKKVSFWNEGLNFVHLLVQLNSFEIQRRTEGRPIIYNNLSDFSIWICIQVESYIQALFTNLLPINHIYLRPSGAHPVSRVGSTAFNTIAVTPAVDQFWFSFTRTVIDDFEGNSKGLLHWTLCGWRISYGRLVQVRICDGVDVTIRS